MRITTNSAVRIHYHLTSPSGELIDSSRGKAPLGYFHGHGNLVPGVESALDGLEQGDRVTAIVAPEQGYGVRDPQLDIMVPMHAFPEDMRAQLSPAGVFHGHRPV